MGGLAGVRDALRRSRLPAAAFPAERSADTGATYAPIAGTAGFAQDTGKSASDREKSYKQIWIPCCPSSLLLHSLATREDGALKAPCFFSFCLLNRGRARGWTDSSLSTDFPTQRDPSSFASAAAWQGIAVFMLCMSSSARRLQACRLPLRPASLPRQHLDEKRGG